MEPNLEFENNNTVEENNTMVATPVIRISETELYGLRGKGYNRNQIANYYGVTTQELYQVMVGFNMVKARTTSEDAPAYIIEPVRDMVELPTLTSSVVEA